MKMRSGWAGLLLIGLFIWGCPGSSVPSVESRDLPPGDGVADGVDLPDTEGGEIGEVFEEGDPGKADDGEGIGPTEVPDAEVIEVLDVEVEVPPPKAPILAFHFVTASGPKGKGEAEVSLGLQDEPPVYAETPGFQVDVVVRTENLENGKEVRLMVAGALVAKVAAVVDGNTGIGEAVFQGVTLTHNPKGYTVAVEATNEAGQTGSDAKLVHVDIGTCGVSLLPPNTACLLKDQDPDTPGVQVYFTVANPERTCDQAVLRYSVGGSQVTLGPQALSSAGTAVFKVTLVESSDEADGIEVLVTAEVSDSKAPERTASLPPLTYILDLVDPTVSITKPDKPLYKLADDTDGNPDNGINIEVSGTVKGNAPSSPVSLSLNGSFLAEVMPDEQGAFSWPGLAITEDGSYALRAEAKDSCGRSGSGEVNFMAKVTTAAYSFVYPKQGAILLAKDDQNPVTTLKYETAFKVFAEDVDPQTSLSVYCRRDQLGSPQMLVGSAVVQGGGSTTIEVPVVLDTQVLTKKVRCQVRDNGANPSASSEVAFQIALPPPVLKILAPTAGAYVTKAQMTVKVFASGLTGSIPVVQVLDENGTVVIDFTPPAIQSTGLSFVLPLTVGGVPIPDGPYTLKVDATDSMGNVASDIAGNVTQVPFTLDLTVPQVEIVQPDHDTIDPALNPGDQDEDPGTPGHQITVKVLVVDGGGPGTTVCLKVNDQAERCEEEGEGEAVFTGVTLIPGPNTLTAYGRDKAGNRGPDATRDLFLNVPGPRVTIVQPPKDGPISVLPFDLIAEVTDLALNPLQGAEATLLVNGAEVETVQSNAMGRATFTLNSLSENGDQFIVKAVYQGSEGYSAPRNLYLKTGIPSLTFLIPVDGQALSAESVECDPGYQDCVLDVVLEATNFEDGSSGTLSVTCGNFEASYPGLVAKGKLTFSGVTLKDQKQCTLSATATDIGGAAAQAGPITVLVDRIPPVVLFDRPTPGTGSLTNISDEDPSAPGLQYHFVIKYFGLPAGTNVHVTYGLVGETPKEIVKATNVAASDTTAKYLEFPIVTLDNGLNVIHVEAFDPAGNKGGEDRLVFVWADQPVVGIYSPAYVADTECQTSTDCMNSGACIEGRCAIPWGIGSFKGVGVSVQNAPDLPSNVRICSDKAPLGASPCSSVGFREVARATVPPSGGVVQIPVSGLPDGFYTLIAEVKVAEGQPWETSLNNPNETLQRRVVYQDLVAPSVVSITSPSDTLPPFGVLNAAEQKASGKVYEIKVEGTEAGTARVFVGGVQQGEVLSFPGSLTVDVTLKEGQNEVYAVLTDVVGNQSPSPPDPKVVYFTPQVDTIAPVLAFLTGPVVKHGDSVDLKLYSDAKGQKVTVTESGALVGEGTVGDDGVVVIPFETYPILTEGPHSLHAEVSDLAGNVATADLDVLVDTIPPDLYLGAPSDLSELADDDDAQPSVPGFQIEVSFGGISDDAKTYKVEVAYNCDETFTVCDPPITLAEGTLTNPGGLEPSLYPTLGVGMTPYYKFIVSIEDAVGNITSAVARVTITLSQCVVTIGGITPGGYLNNSLCPTPGEDCNEVAKTLSVGVRPACGHVNTLRLFVNGSLALEKAFNNNPETITYTFQHGTAPQLEVRVYEGPSLVASSGVQQVTVDLHDPIVDFTIPAEGSENKWGIAQDLDTLKTGLQRNFELQASDEHLSGGQLVALTYQHGQSTVALKPENVTIPYSFTSNSEALTLQRVTLPDQTTGVVTAVVRDAAGNEAVSSFSAVVDLVPPAAPEVSVVAKNPRRPSVTLQWQAPGDNGNEAGTKAAFYDVRYSKWQINTVEDFETACHVTELVYTEEIPKPEVAGTLQTFTVTGPDIRPPDVQENGKPCKFETNVSGFAGYYFAIRAYDDVGNGSNVVSVYVDLAMRHAKLMGSGEPWNGADFQRRVYGAGDINGDGLGDLALGGGQSDSFCVIYGHGSGSDKVVADLTFTAGSGDHYLCIQGPAGSRTGTPVVALGDVNGDGIDDLGVGEGSNSPAYPYAFRIYLGRPGGIANTPNITITGMKFTAMGVTAAGQGDFNGDGISDIIVGSPRDNVAYIIPGNQEWGVETTLSIDLTSESDRTTYRIVTLAMSGALSTTQYGLTVGFLKDIDKDGYDEAAVAAYADMNPSAVVVTRGRDVPGALVLTASRTNDGSGDDANVVRLLPDSGTKGSFGTSAIDGLHDLDGDGRGDLVVGHYYEISTGSSLKAIYGFYGSFAAKNFGKVVRIGAAPSQAEDGKIYRNEKGFTIGGPYIYPRVIGNLDDDPFSVPSADLGYVLFSQSSIFGKVFIRLNLGDPQGAFAQGSFPYQSPVLVDPDNPTGTLFGQYRVVPIQDFNGDGLTDILVGTNNAGYAVILY